MPQIGPFLRRNRLFFKVIGKIISGLAVGGFIGAGAAPSFGAIW